ncbi:5440_t:CDS:2 [Funneliformis geosporum]|nr:5440_t:CDS:2 [Funneliformis geosporum]
MLNEKMGIDDNQRDLEVVSTRELKGWYLANTANEPYVIAAMSVFIPIILETYSSQAGFKLDDRNVPCDIEIEDYKCVTKFGFWIVDSTSYSFYIIAISVLTQCIVYIGIGSLADYGNNRKKMLIGFSYAGALFTIAYILVLEPNMYWLAGLLTILSNVCFGAATVFWLAYIPVYTHIHPEVIQVKRNNDENGDATKEEICEIEERISNRLSVMSLIWCIPAGVLVLAIGSIFALIMKDKILSLRIGCVIVGIWWVSFLTFPVLWMKNRVGPPLPKVGTTIRSAKHLVETVKFLVAWFILSDGYGTITTVATLFGKKELGLSQVQLLIAAMIIPICAMIGAYVFLKIQLYFNLSTKTMIIITTSLHSLVPLYALLGFIAPFGFKYSWEIWLFAIYFGSLIGAVQSYCRVLFGSMIPKGHENEFFSLFEITDKGSSWLGPLVVGIIGDVTHNLRNAYWYILFSMAFPILIILTVNVDKGKKDAELFVENEKIGKMRVQKKCSSAKLLPSDNFWDYEIGLKRTYVTKEVIKS